MPSSDSGELFSEWVEGQRRLPEDVRVQHSTDVGGRTGFTTPIQLLLVQKMRQSDGQRSDYRCLYVVSLRGYGRKAGMNRDCRGSSKLLQLEGSPRSFTASNLHATLPTQPGVSSV